VVAPGPPPSDDGFAGGKNSDPAGFRRAAVLSEDPDRPRQADRMLERVRTRPLQALPPADD
jgi:hypothetical protein